MMENTIWTGIAIATIFLFCTGLAIIIFLFLEHKKSTNKILQLIEEQLHMQNNLLEKKNKQLEQYAFINSHELRAPLARILSLLHLVEIDEACWKEYHSLITVSALKLDEIVRKINQVINYESEECDLKGS